MLRDNNPTTSETIQSLKEDTLKRNSYLNHFMSTLSSVSLHTIFALDGEWGTGKTYFVKQLEYLSKKDAAQTKKQNTNNRLSFPNINNDTIDYFSNSYRIFYFNVPPSQYS